MTTENNFDVFLTMIRHCNQISPEVGGTTEFVMPFNVACGICVANAAIGFIYVPCAVAAAIRAACCCKYCYIQFQVIIFECRVFLPARKHRTHRID